MPYGTQGIDTPSASVTAGVIPYSVFWVGINYYADRCPLIARLRKGAIGSASFKMNNDNFRPRSSTLGAGYTSGGGTVTVADGSMFTVGDVINIDSERMLVTAVNTSTNVLTVTTAFEGTTNANHSNGAAVSLITNARTGADVDQNAINRTPTPVDQYVQTVQHAYQVGGGLASKTNYMGGAVTPLARSRGLAMQHVMDDFERAMVDGKGASGANPVQKGLRTLLTTNAVTSPTSASAYKPSDLTKDVLQKAFAAGGRPNMLLVGQNFMTGFATWGFNLQMIQPRATELGTQVVSFYVPWLPGIEIVPSPIALGAGEAVALNTDEVLLRLARPLDDQPRGRRGDAVEGDIIMEGAIDVENEYHHVFLSNVTGFAPQS